MRRVRPLATHLAISHGLIGLFACLTVGALLALLLPEFYLRQREAALISRGEALAAGVAPVLAGGREAVVLPPDTIETGAAAVVDAKQRVVAVSSARGGGRGWHSVE